MVTGAIPNPFNFTSPSNETGSAYRKEYVCQIKETKKMN
jgi:hypothetical protein